MAIRILVADDHRMLRESLCAMLSAVEGFRVVADADNGLRTVSLVEEHRPDIAVIDVEMPDLNGVETTRRIVESHPATRVLGLSMHCESSYISRMLEAGATGYLVKQGAFEELVRAIQVVARGETYLSPSVAGLVVGQLLQGKPPQKASPSRTLTPREREVLQMLAEGKSSKEIGGNLQVSSKTVDTYRQQLMRKLDLRSIAELTKFAIREGITALN